MGHPQLQKKNISPKVLETYGKGIEHMARTENMDNSHCNVRVSRHLLVAQCCSRKARTPLVILAAIRQKAFGMEQ